MIKKVKILYKVVDEDNRSINCGISHPVYYILNKVSYPRENAIFQFLWCFDTLKEAQRFASDCIGAKIFRGVGVNPTKNKKQLEEFPGVWRRAKTTNTTFVDSFLPLEVMPMEGSAGPEPEVDLLYKVVYQGNTTWESVCASLDRGGVQYRLNELTYPKIYPPFLWCFHSFTQAKEFEYEMGGDDLIVFGIGINPRHSIQTTFRLFDTTSRPAGTVFVDGFVPLEVDNKTNPT